jgi:hypothetical protein
MAGQIRASAVVPAAYRFLLFYLEPLLTIGGIIFVTTKPADYAAMTTRNVVSSIPADNQFLFTQLAGGWLHFAFTEAIVLRLVDDLRTWRCLCAAMLMSDLMYCHSIAQAVGGWGEWVVLANWMREDWIAAVMTWPFVLARVAILLGIGLRKPAKVE